MPVKGEIVSENDRRLPSRVVAQTVLFGLDVGLKLLHESGERGWTRGGKRRFHTGEHIVGVNNMSRAERERQYRIQEANGYVVSAEIRQNKDGKVTYAGLNRLLPARFSEKTFPNPPLIFKADSEKVCMQVNHNTEEIGPRIVLDAWKVPATQLSELLVADELDMDAYNELYRNLFNRRNELGIPSGAVDVKHWVLGRPDEVLHAKEHSWISNVMSGFSAAVHSEIAFNRHIDAEIMAGNL
jgi:hypothetical protein